MSTNLKGETMAVPNASEMKIGIVVAQWNREITQKLLDGAVDELLKNGCAEENIEIRWVPGSFELTMGAKLLATYGDFDALIVLGCVIEGETRHFDFVCQGVTQGVTQLQLDEFIPVAFGLLTTCNLEQAQERAGGKYGNKGAEAAQTAIIMASMHADVRDKFFDESYDEQDQDDDSINIHYS